MNSALLSLTLFVFIATGYVCPRGRDSECVSVSRDIQYVQCVNHTCVCRVDQGFVGAAAPSSKCSCPSGYSVFYTGSGYGDDDDQGDNQGHGGNSGHGNDNNIPYCVKLTDAIAYAKQQARNAILTSIISDLYHSLVWPTPQTIMFQLITGQTVGGIWDHVAPDAVGRVDPAGDFSTIDGIVEYFYGAVWTPNSHVLEVNIQKLIVEGNIVYVDVDIFFNNFENNGSLILAYNLTQSGSFTFNSDNKIKSMDLIIHNLGFAVNRLSSNQPGLQANINVCSVLLFVANCTSTMDPDGYFTDFNSCLAFMAGIPYGTWDNLRTNSVACRTYHAILAIARPQVHCVHSGRTGGGKCVDIPYEDLYLTQF